MTPAQQDDSAIEATLDRWKTVFTFVGSIAGIAALAWNIGWTISNEHRSYLMLSLELRRTNDPTQATAVVSVENRSQFSKSIDYAALLVSPSGRDIREVVSELRECNHAPTAMSLSSEPASGVLNYLPKPDDPIYCDGDISLIPLQFFYREQLFVGNERLTSSALIDQSRFRNAGQSKQAYDVRFIVTGNGRTRTSLDLLTR